MRAYLILYVLPAAGLLVLAFWAGAHANALFGLIGFLSFFTLAVALLVEGWKRKTEKRDD